MKIGLFGINFGLCGDVDAMVRVARHAEESELESLWTGEHVVLPDPQAPPSPAAPRTPFLDPSVALGHLAAVTTRAKLATGIIILPQRNPVELAKELASVDVVSNGRLIFGLGAGEHTVVADFPAGTERYYVDAHGYEMVIVNGVPAMEHGKHTGALPGEVLRGA